MAITKSPPSSIKSDDRSTLKTLANYFANQTSANILPPLIFSEKHEEVDVIEVREHDQNCFVQCHSVHDSDVETLSQRFTDPARNTILKIACIPLVMREHVYSLTIRQHHFEELLQACNLQDTFRFAKTSVTSFDVLPRYHDDKMTGLNCSVFMLSLIGLLFTYDSTLDLTLAIIWCSPQLMSTFKAALTELKDLSKHPLYLLLVTIVAFEAELDSRLVQINSEIASVEGRTGYHGWETLVHPTANDGLSSLSSKMSGLATSLAAYRRVMCNMQEMLEALREFSSIDEIHVSMSSTIAKRGLDDCLKLLSRRLRFQFSQIDLHETRARNQLTALFNMINRHEMDLSLEVARDSRTIANATKRDSSSMKILAAVTVLFLPGTFVASLLSTAFFRWRFGNDEEVVSSQFWIYWATTMPLTLVTIVVCFGLSKRWAILGRWQDQTSLESLEPKIL